MTAVIYSDYIKGMASASQSTYPRLSLTFQASDIAKLRAVRDALAEIMGRASYVTAIAYGLTLAAAHLGIDAPDPLPPLPSVEPPKL